MAALRSVLAALLAAVVPVPTASPAQTPGSNVTITTCHAQLDKPQLRIGFTNVALKDAIEIDFDVAGSAGPIQSVKDVGKFATGTPISHVFRLPLGASPLGLSSAHCTVEKVVYADGTSWQNPTPGP
jgi:hypothetical protein